MLIVFFEGIRSERQLLRLGAVRLRARWHADDDLHEPLSDHSSLTKMRTRNGLEALRRFFDTTAGCCQVAREVWGRRYRETRPRWWPRPR